METGELPQEVILSIQRILEIQATGEIDRLDGLSGKFNAVEILNDFFPDGTFHTFKTCKAMSWRIFSRKVSGTP